MKTSLHLDTLRRGELMLKSPAHLAPRATDTLERESLPRHNSALPSSQSGSNGATTLHSKAPPLDTCCSATCCSNCRHCLNRGPPISCVWRPSETAIGGLIEAQAALDYGERLRPLDGGQIDAQTDAETDGVNALATCLDGQ